MKKLALFISFVVVIVTTGCIRSLNPIVDYEDMTLDDRIIGTWEYQTDRVEGIGLLPTKIEIGRVCRPIYEKYDIYTNAEGKLDSNHTIMSTEIRSSNDDIPYLKGDLKFKELDSLNQYYVSFEQLEEINGNEIVKGVYFKIALTELNGLVFFDLLHKEDPGSYNDMTGYNIPAHYIGVVDITKDRLDFRLLDTDKMASLIKNRRVRLKHQLLEGEGYLDQEAIILTASTNELRSFFSKYGNEDELFSESVIYNRNE